MRHVCVGDRAWKTFADFRLLKSIYPDQEELKRLSQKGLLEIVAERFAYGAMASGFKPKTREEMRAERGGTGRAQPMPEKKP
jgi:hypothetical protein